MSKKPIKISTPWGVVIDKYRVEKGLNKITFCQSLGMSGTGQPYQRWMKGAEIAPETLKKIQEVHPLLHELLVPVLASGKTNTRDYTPENASQQSRLATENFQDYNVIVDARSLMRVFYIDMKLINASFAERLAAIGPIIDKFNV